MKLVRQHIVLYFLYSLFLLNILITQCLPWIYTFSSVYLKSKLFYNAKLWDGTNWDFDYGKPFVEPLHCWTGLHLCSRSGSNVCFCFLFWWKSFKYTWKKNICDFSGFWNQQLKRNVLTSKDISKSLCVFKAHTVSRAWTKCDGKYWLH